jgi:hypothetical protein
VLARRQALNALAARALPQVRLAVVASDRDGQVVRLSRQARLKPAR